MDDVWWLTAEDLDEKQLEVVELELDGSYLVTGPPGSGKSNLLLLRANYLANADRGNVAVVVFTRTLHDFLRSGAEHYRFPADRIMTSYAFTQDLLWQCGLSMPDGLVEGDKSKAFDTKRREAAKSLRALIDSGKLGARYDTILLDEAQDYLDEEVENFLSLATNVFAVADARQQIYEASGGSVLERRLPNMIRLARHYRNGFAICRAADHLSKENKEEPLEKTSNYDESAYPAKVERVSSDSLEAMAKEIATRLATQLKTYPQSYLAILVPRRSDLEAISDLLRASEIGDQCAFQVGDSAMLDHTRRISVSTLHAAKGLEFRAVHLACAEGLKNFRTQMRMAFVAVTRAKTSLVVHHIKPLPGYLDGAIGAAQGPPKKPSMKKVFGGE